MKRPVFVFSVWLVIIFTQRAMSLRPEQIMIVCNSDIETSIQIARHYSAQRDVPAGNICPLALGAELKDSISRKDYDEKIKIPLREKLASDEFTGKIKCLLTVWGVPYKVGPRGRAETPAAAEIDELFKAKKTQAARLIESFTQMTFDETPPENIQNKNAKKISDALNNNARQALKQIRVKKDSEKRYELYKKWANLHREAFGPARTYRQTEKIDDFYDPPDRSDKILQNEAKQIFNKAESENWNFQRKLRDGYYDYIERVAGCAGILAVLESDIANINGKETDAALDSELAMINFDEYELYRWRENELANRLFWWGVKTLMVSRLDGPSPKISQSLIDKALTAEKTSLTGNACIDAGYDTNRLSGRAYEEFDEYLVQCAEMLKRRTTLNVRFDKDRALFQPGTCSETALYCGWYSLKQYIDAFDFVPGAVGYHIASLEAVDLRDINSHQWCPAMLKDGVTATIGAVAEPYLSSFPRPDDFFFELTKGKCLAEAYFRTNPYNSWRMMLIGDPLYTPFK